MQKPIVFLSLVTSIVLSFNLQNASAELDSKKTVCSVTINSNNEIEQFKQKLSKKQWNFIELTELEGVKVSNQESTNNKKSWFIKACEQKIKCDILLVSGHFGGTFFGQSDFTLSMEELESSSCNADCDGIINQPKEVFLFGCNTLAGKQKDHRSPEVYLQTLLNDGFSRQQAEQVVAFRYSSFGESFSARMSQVFENTPRIYGFYSVGPSGKNVEPMISKYLVNSKEEYKDFFSYINLEKINKNEKLFTALKSTALAQISGIQFYDSNWQSRERPYCYMSNDKLSRLDKLKYVVNVMLSGRTLNIMPHIKKFIKEFYDSKTATNEELKEIQKVASSEKVKNDFNQILNLKGDVYLGLKLNTAFLMKALNLKNAAEYDKYIQSVIKLNELVTVELKDMLCSLDVEVFDINPNSIHKDNWQNYEFYKLLRCLKPQNEAIHTALVEVMKKDSTEYIRQYAAYALGEIKPQSEAIHMAFVEVMKTDSSEYVRRGAADALGKIKPQSEAIQMALVEVMKKDSSEDARRGAADVLDKINANSR